ncbi:MAG: hypothetical protein HKM04_02285 [Legionellales bacterium]|nr:hypothetical protein [Legionellales bacterium]
MLTRWFESGRFLPVTQKLSVKQLGSVDNWFFEAKKERIEEKLVLV